jgi:hypothetical protein
MKTVRFLLLLPILYALMLFNPLFAGGHGHGTGHSSHAGFGHTGGHEHFGFNHERHEGWRGNRGHFNGFGGTFYGQIVILDDGCYFWDGLMWEITDCN